MGTGANRIVRQAGMTQSAAWAAGIGITLVEMQYGIDYVFTHVAGHVGTIVGWLPMISVVRQIWQ